MKDPVKTISRIGMVLAGAAALAPIAYYGANIAMKLKCPNCGAELDLVKRPGAFEPELVVVDEDE